MRISTTLLKVIIFFVVVVGCGQLAPESNLEQKGSSINAFENKHIIADNAFFYYADLGQFFQADGNELLIQSLSASVAGR